MTKRSAHSLQLKLLRELKHKIWLQKNIKSDKIHAKSEKLITTYKEDLRKIAKLGEQRERFD